MAVPDKQAIMVIHQEGMTTSGLAPKASSPRSLFVVLKPLHAGGGGQDEGALLANNNGTSLGTPTVGFQRLSSISLSAMADTNNSNQLWNLPAEITCKGVTVTLDNNNMWNEFYRCKTEMILTKQGRRMFPCCRFRISGLEPFQNYTLVMDMHPVDNHRYKWSDRRWETNGKGDPHIARSFVHPESPATGLDWMQNPVSFYKLKLTNNPLDQENHIVINSMHRYLPRLHIIPADKTTDGIQLDGPDIITFSFPQTEFFAVTAYQNLSITQLKIDYNPFAKGFREDSNNSRSSKPKIGLPTETVESEVKPSRETTTLNNLKTLPVRSKSKCETSASESEQLRKIPSDAEITSSPAASLTTTQSNTQPAAPTTSETSSILTCPVANSGVSACSSLSPTTAFFTSLTTSPTIPDMPTSLSPASLVVTDPEQDQGPDSDLEHKESPTLSSESNIATVPTSNITSDTVLDYKQEDASVILSSLSDNTVPERTLSSTTLDTDAVSSDVPCPLSPACSPPEIIPVSLFHSLQNDDVCNNVSTSVSTAEHTLDSCTLPSAEFVPEAPNQSPMSEDNDVDLAFSPSSPTFSIPSPAPSSPDPFPPGLFIDRPIPPRKSLDPFPPCLNRPRPHVDIMNAVPSSFSVAKPGCPGDLDLRFTTGVTTELPSPMPCSEPWVSKDAKQPQQPVHESVSKKPKVKNRKGGKLKLSDDAVTGGTIPVPHAAKS
uniref:T-box domain-containing protein n=1 Tax=Astyanax mexicanus TaxID=7994 RepID=A0A3B1IBN6_ASTMX